MPTISKSDLRKMIANGDTAEALDAVLQALPQGHKSYNKFIQLRGQWKSLEVNTYLGLEDRRSVETSQNRIINATLEFVNALPDNAFSSTPSQTATPKTMDIVREIATHNATDYAYDLFFSFSSHDLEEARLLCDALRGYGLRVFFSADDMRTKGGHQFSEVIDDALETSRHFLLHCTPNAMQSDWVRKEYRAFHDQIHIYDQKNRRFLIFEGNDFDPKGLSLTYRNNQRVSGTDEIISAILFAYSTQAKAPTRDEEKIAHKKAATQKVSDVGAAIPIASERAGSNQEKTQKEKEIANYSEQVKASDKERTRIQRRRQQDESAWKTTLSAVNATENLEEKIEAFEAYLEVDEYDMYNSEAEMQILKLREEQHRLRIEAKKRRRAEEEKQHEKEAEVARLAAIEVEKYRKEAAEKRKTEEDEKQRRSGMERLEREAETVRLAALENTFLSSLFSGTRFVPEMVFVRGGTFQMGGGQPILPVTLSEYHIGKYPVTFEEYDIFCTETKREKPADEGWGRGKRPVINVSYDDAITYCKWISKRTGKNYDLPSEAQWEFAAKGGTTSKSFKFAGSNNLSEVGWFWENSGDKKLSGEWKMETAEANNCKTHPVGEKKANELGIFDMSGNVHEWCSDWFGEYTSGSKSNPTGPKSGLYRVFRGGSFIDGALPLVTRLNFGVPSGRVYMRGFRIACVP